MLEIYGIHEAIQLLAGRWELEILRALDIRPHGHAELRRVLGAEGKQLTRVLHRLRRRGLVDRNVATEVSPVRVTYSLTDDGDRLLTAAVAFSHWRGTPTRDWTPGGGVEAVSTRTSWTLGQRC